MSRLWLAPWFVLFAAGASAAPLALTYDSRFESKSVFAGLLPDSPIHIEGRLDVAGEIRDTLTFRAGSSTLSMSAGWLLAPPENRTVGVNIELYDNGGALVSSDSFRGSDGTLARSDFIAPGLIAGGLYRLEFTGLGVGAGRFHIELADGATLPSLPQVLPSMPDPASVSFDTHIGAKEGTSTIAAGGSLLIDGALKADGGHSIVNSTTVRVTSGALSAGIEWIVGTPDDPQRTVGVNVDLLDAFGIVVASDAFRGVTGGQAFSQFSVLSLADGDYRLEFTGLGVNDLARYRINLVGSATAPGFEPIAVDPLPNSVPEPSPLLMLVLGAGLLGVVRRRKRREPMMPRNRPPDVHDVFEPGTRTRPMSRPRRWAGC